MCERGNARSLSRVSRSCALSQEAIDMFGLQPIHIVLIVVVAVILFAPRQLPELGRGLAKAITEFKKGIRETPDSDQENVRTSSNKSSSS